MGNKSHLRLVDSKPQPRIEQWLTKVRTFEINIPKNCRWWKTEEEKAEELRKAFTEISEDFYFTTGDVDLFQIIQVEETLKDIIGSGMLDYYYKRYILNQQFNEKMNKMEAEHRRNKA